MCLLHLGLCQSMKIKSFKVSMKNLLFNFEELINKLLGPLSPCRQNQPENNHERFVNKNVSCLISGVRL